MSVNVNVCVYVVLVCVCVCTIHDACDVLKHEFELQRVVAVVVVDVAIITVIIVVVVIVVVVSMLCEHDALIKRSQHTSTYIHHIGVEQMMHELLCVHITLRHTCCIVKFI